MITHHAELHNAVKYTSISGSWLEGRIYNDTHTHGNHPIRDGLSVVTTSIESDAFNGDGDRIINTRNTIYKIVGAVEEVQV